MTCLQAFLTVSVNCNAEMHAVMSLSFPPRMACAWHLDQAIFGDEYRPVCSEPPRFTIHLREPGSGAGGDEDDAADAPPAGPPSRLFSLTFTLPATYPAQAQPHITITGPLGANDARRHALAARLAQEAADMQAAGAGCVFQVVEAAKEWIDANLPADVGSRREGAVAAVASSAGGGGAASGHKPSPHVEYVSALAAAGAGGASVPRDGDDGQSVSERNNLGAMSTLRMRIAVQHRAIVFRQASRS